MKKIQIERLKKTFSGPDGEPVHALDDISLEIDDGELVVLLGASGSGKTTLLRCVAGLERPSGGEITLDGKPVFSATKRIETAPDKRNMGMVFQSYALWPHLTVADNVAYPLKRRGIKKDPAGARVAAALEMVNCEALADRYPNEISGGQQQRVALARAIVAEPSVMLFDEPLSNLDAGLRERMRTEIKLVQRKTGCTALYVTHDQREAMAIADRVVVMDAGQVLQVGPPDKVYARPLTSFVASFLGAANLIDVQHPVGEEGFATEVGTLVVNASHGVDRDHPALQVAIRQESMVLVDGAASAHHNVIEANFEFDEFLGDHRLASFHTASGLQLFAKLSTGIRLRPGQTCRLGVPFDDTVLVIAGDAAPAS